MELSTSWYRYEVGQGGFTGGNENRFVSDEARQWVEFAVFVITMAVISVLGNTANCINLVVFIKQGFSDSVNISLIGLTLADLGCLIPVLWKTVSFNPLFHYSDIPFDSVDIQYLTSAWPHVCFARITGLVTGLITLERCLCVVLPLTVKRILTPRRTALALAAIYLVMFASVAPVFSVIHFGPKFYDLRNKTLYGLVYDVDGAAVENVSFTITIFAQLFSILLVITCTAVTTITLKKNSKWRRNVGISASARGDGELTKRDKKVVKMVVFISCIFITCFLPTAVNLIVGLFVAEYSFIGKFRNVYQVVWCGVYVLETTNSSVNIIVYYNMSSKYRSVFQQLFCKRKADFRRK